MLRTVLSAGVAACLAACANGWPHCGELSRCAAGVRHFLTVDCTPTGSKIPRQGCATSTPASKASAEDLDRARQQSGAATPAKLPGH